MDTRSAAGTLAGLALMAAAASARADEAAWVQVTHLQASAVSLTDGSVLPLVAGPPDVLLIAALENGPLERREVVVNPAGDPASARVTDGLSRAAGAYDPAAGTLALQGVLSLADSAWNRAGTGFEARTVFALAPHAEIIVSGHVSANFTAPEGFGVVGFGTQLNAYTGQDGYSFLWSGPIDGPAVERDFQIRASNPTDGTVEMVWATSGTASAALVPEPAGWALLLAGLPVLLWRRPWHPDAGRTRSQPPASVE